MAVDMVEVESIGVIACSHVAYFVRDLTAARHFYGDLLGLPEIPRPPFPGEGAWYQIGAQQLHLGVWSEYLPPPIAPHLVVSNHLALHAPNFHATVESLRRAGVSFALEPRRSASDGLWRAFCADPDGNMIEITNQGPLAPTAT